MNEPILVWSFYDAPKDLQDLSPHGGDEDWLAELPPAFANNTPAWIETGSGFGCRDVSRHDHPHKPGWVVCIGSHA